MELWRRSKRYLKENWGAPFVIAFIVLLISSAVLLSAGSQSSANNVAIYAFYALVLGVVLQIASYVKYGEEKRELPYKPSGAPIRKSWRLEQKTIALVVIVLIVAAGMIGVFFYKQPSHNITTSKSQTSRTIGKLSVGVGFVTELPQANNAVEILVGINQTGGLQPYNFTAYWSDGVNQSNSAGVFIRSFYLNESIPTSLKAVVKSSDGQSGTVTAEIPTVNRTTSSSTASSTTSSTTFPTVTFIESGLPAGAKWTVTIPGSAFNSNASKISFNYPHGGNLSYTMSGPYDANNFAWAFVPSPRNGTIIVNESIQINVAFSNESVLVPANHLFVMTSHPTASSTGANSEELSVTYLNTFPEQVQVIVFATVKNNATGSVSIGTATIEPLASGSQTALFFFSRLSTGNYTASFFVTSSKGLQLSQTTNSTFTIAV